MISDTLKKLAKFGWFLPGFLLWAAYPPMGERADVWFALAPLMWLSRREGCAAIVAKRWFQSGIFFWVATLSWMPAIVKNGGPWPLVALGWFALAAYCAAYFAAYGYFAARIWAWAREGSYARRLAAIVVLEPLLWCGLELIRSRFLGGFAWNQLGVVPANGLFTGAPAALGGVYLLSALVIVVNGSIAGIAERFWYPERSGFAALRKYGMVETILVALLVWSVYRASDMRWLCDSDDGLLEDNRCVQDVQTLRVAMIQRNMPCVFSAKDERENPYNVYGELLGRVKAIEPQLIVLAESALSEFGPVDQQGAVNFAEFVGHEVGAPLIAGGVRYEDGCEYNSAALYVPSSLRRPSAKTDIQIYDKVHLVPFGEFIPGDKLVPMLQKLAPVGSCTPGEVKTLTLPGRPEIPLGVSICFEDTDSALVRSLARQGARVLVFITNDSWFSKSIEPEQHAWQAVARAIETGLPVVRVGNSGVTGTIAPNGNKTWLTGADGMVLTDARGTMIDRVAIPSASGPRTPYVVYGDRPLAIAFALMIVWSLVGRLRRRTLFKI